MISTLAVHAMSGFCFCCWANCILNEMSFLSQNINRLIVTGIVSYLVYYIIIPIYQEEPEMCILKVKCEIKHNKQDTVMTLYFQRITLLLIAIIAKSLKKYFYYCLDLWF